MARRHRFDEYELNHLRIVIERMVRAGMSTHEIERALRRSGVQTERPPARRRFGFKGRMLARI